MLHDAVHFRSGKISGKNPVLREILKVSSCKGTSVRICGRSIPSVVACCLKLCTDSISYFFQKISVIALGHQNLSRERSTIDLGNKVIQSRRTVTVYGSRLLNGLNCGGLPTAHINQRTHVLKTHLIQKLIPLFIIIRRSP